MTEIYILKNKKIDIQIRSKQNLMDLDSNINEFILKIKNNFSINNNNKLSNNIIIYSGICGLNNIGNTCYFNSALQCLFHSKPLIELLKNDNILNEINYENPLGSNGLIIQTFQKLLKDSLNGNYSSINPSSLLHYISLKRSQFNNRNQEDSQELLLVLLDLLHEDLNNYKKKNILNNFNCSLISDIFYGNFKSIIKCPNCLNESITYEPFSNISLPLPLNFLKSPIIYFIFLNPLESILKFQINLSDLDNLNNLKIFIQNLINKNIEIIFAFGNEDGTNLNFITNITQIYEQKFIFAFEINLNSYYAILHLSIKTKSFFNSKTQIIEGPYLLEISNENIKSNEILLLCNNYFNFLWDKNILINSLTLKQQELKNNFQNFEEFNKEKFIIELEKSIFSKTMRFKPEILCNNIAKRHIYCILNPKFINNDFRWDLIKK